MAGTDKIVVVAISLILVATLGVAGWNLLGNSETATTVTGEAVTGGVADGTVKLTGNHDNALVASSFRLYNSSGTIPTAGNYSIAESTGIITWSNPTNIINGGAYLASYKSGTIPGVTQTLVKIVIAVIAAIAIIMGLLAYVRRD